MSPSPKDKEQKAERIHKAFKKAFWPTFSEQLTENEIIKNITFKETPNKPTTLREWEIGEHEAMNIVYQLGDLLYDALPKSLAHQYFVDARQETNDRAIEFTRKIINSLLTSHNTELLQKIEGMKMEHRDYCEDWHRPEFCTCDATVHNQALDEVINIITQEK